MGGRGEPARSSPFPPRPELRTRVSLLCERTLVESEAGTFERNFTDFDLRENRQDGDNCDMLDLSSPLRRIRSVGGDVVSVNPPRVPGPYPSRDADCESAVERDFLREIVNAATPFVDLDSVLMAIADDAMRAGWSEQELTEAVQRLAVRHRLKIGQRTVG